MRTIAATSSGNPRRPIGGIAGRCAGRPVASGSAAHRVDATRHHAIDGNALWREIERERLCHPGKPGLRRHDVRPAGGAAVPGLAADVDDRPAARANEVRQTGMRAEECAVQDHGQHPPPVGVRHFGERLLGTHGRIVDQRIDTSEALDRRGDQPGDRVGIGDVGDVARCPPAGDPDRANRCVEVFARMEGIDHHVGACRGERRGDRTADVARGPGDQHDFPGQFPARGQVRIFRHRAVCGVSPAPMRRRGPPEHRTGSDGRS